MSDKKNGSKLTPAVGYVRMSSGKQDKSPKQQRDEIVKLAKKHGCEIIRWYSDEAISGDATERRKDFQRMIRDAEEKGDFAAILCWDQDRFGRFDSIEAGRWIYPLRQAGVWLITVAQGVIDWNDFAGRMIYSIQQEGKHQFLIDLSKNVLRGKIEAAKHGRGATVPPYGFDRAYHDQTGKLVKRVPYGAKFTKPKGWTMRFVRSKDAVAVEVVQRIFHTFDTTDSGLSGLAGDLNRRGIPSPQGKTWSIQTVQKILTNRTYTGANKFGENPEGKYHYTSQTGEIERGNGHRRKGEPIVVEGVHDVLIDVGTFGRVQAKLAERGRTGRRVRHNRYVLSGVLRCGHCGGTLAGKGYNGKNVPRYYACVTGATRPGVCCRYQIPQEAIEDYVLGIITDRLLSDDAIDRIRQAIHRKAKNRRGWKATTQNMRTQLDALDQKIAKGNENLLLAGPEHMASLSALLSDWKAERAKLQAQLETAARSPSGASEDELAKRAVAELKRLRQHVGTGDPLKVRAVIHEVVEEVRLWWEPYGKRNKRLAHGVLRYRNVLEFSATGTKTGSATSSAAGTATAPSPARTKTPPRR